MSEDWYWASLGGPDILVKKPGAQVVLASVRGQKLVTRNDDGILVPITKDHPVARLIVRAVNNHDDLVAALENARNELMTCSLELNGEDYNNPALNAILAKAESP